VNLKADKCAGQNAGRKRIVPGCQLIVLSSIAE
jgi:hypothetical protein